MNEIFLEMPSLLYVTFIFAVCFSLSLFFWIKYRKREKENLSAFNSKPIEKTMKWVVVAVQCLFALSLLCLVVNKLEHFYATHILIMLTLLLSIYCAIVGMRQKVYSVVYKMLYIYIGYLIVSIAFLFYYNC